MKAKWNIAWFDGVTVCQYKSIQQPFINQVSGTVSFINAETNKQIYLNGNWSIEEL